MRKALRFTVIGAAAAMVLTLLGLALGWYLVSRSLPDWEQRLVLDGLDAEVRIVRDANAVPHIFAETDHDALFALGLVHAQDRLWQMELNRRAAQGRLAALFGARAFRLDRAVKNFDLYGLAQASYRFQTPETRAALDAYAAGVNAWIAQVNARSLGRGAPEFFVFAPELAPWTATDSLAVLKMMAMRLTSSARNEIRRARFLLSLPPARVADILPDYPNAPTTVPPRYSDLFPGARFAEAPVAGPDPLSAMLGIPEAGFAGASNAWAVDASRSSSRAPLLANDPHLWLSAPSLWYLADVQGPGMRAIGGTLPGVPAVLIGRNEDVGWGLTTATVDDQDVFIERLDQGDRNRYLTPDGWAEMEVREVRIEVAGEAPRLVTFRRTRHGPVLDANEFGVDAVTPDGHAAALAWTALSAEDRTMSALVRLMTARSVDDGLAMSGLPLAPVQVITMADRERIAMTAVGSLPLRAAGSPSRGRVPSPGWTGETDWVGTLPREAFPRIVAPSEGAVANANNKLVDRPFPRHLGYDWGDPYRIRRIEKELSGRPFHSRDGFVALQTDAVSEMARSVLPLIARDLWWRPESDEVPETRARSLEMLKDWTGEMDRHAPEPLIFAEWARQLTLLIAGDELGDLVSLVPGARPIFLERVFRNVDGAAVWCDIDKTPPVESCAAMAAAALDRALERLAEDYGRNIEGWRWGAAHVARQDHAPLSLQRPLDLIFSVENETSGWNWTVLRGVSRGDGPEPFQNVHAGGLRAVYDFADPDRSLIVISTGQSGHPFSRWYDHLSDLWARGGMIPMSMSETDARTGSVGEMVLQPG